MAVAGRFFGFALLVMLVLTGCDQKYAVADMEDALAENGSTREGLCLSGFDKDTIEFAEHRRDTLKIRINRTEDKAKTIVRGPLNKDDFMAITVRKDADGLTATHIINMVALLGEWKDGDKRLTIRKGGVVKITTGSETKSYSMCSWRVIADRLIIADDVFEILKLTADTLELKHGSSRFTGRRIGSVPNGKELKLPPTMMSIGSSGAGFTQNGICGDVDSCTFEFIMPTERDTLKIINDGQSGEKTVIKGELQKGDSLQVLVRKIENERIARRIINLTSLVQGWRNKEKTFFLHTDGVVEMFENGEMTARGRWNTHKWRLGLAGESFDIIHLSADSLVLENDKGRAVYKSVDYGTLLREGMK